MTCFTLTALQEIRRSWITIVVVVTATTLWPVILLAHLNQRIGHVWYSIAFAIGDFLFLRRVDKRLKKKLFESLSNNYQNGMRVLEIGAGFGSNFSFYPQDFAFRTLDRNPQLNSFQSSIQQRYPNIRMEDSIVGNAENMSQIKDETFDILIATHTMCCIDDPPRAVKEMFRILKKVRISHTYINEKNY